MRGKFIVILFFACLSAYSQSTRVDSLSVLANTLTGRAQIDAFNALSHELLSYDFKKSKDYAQKALRLSEKAQYNKGTAEALIYDAVAEFSVGHDSISIPEFKKSISICRSSQLPQLEGFALTYLGLNYKNLNKLDSSESFLQRAYSVLKDGKQPYYLSFLYLNLADLYALKNEPTLQLDYLKKSWRIRMELPEKKYLVYVGIKLCSYYRRVGNNDEALSYLNKSQKSLGKDTVGNEEISVIYKERALIYASIGRMKDALELLSKSREFYSRNNSTLDLTNLCINFGVALSEMGSYESSLKNLFDGVALAEANHYEHELTQLFFNIGWNYYVIGQNTLAHEFAEKTLTASQKHNYKPEEAFAYNLMGKLAERDKKFPEALDYFTKALSIRQNLADYIGTASTLLNLGMMYAEMGELAKAENYAQQSLNMEEKINHGLGIAQGYLVLGQIHLKMKRLNTASIFFDRAESVSKKARVFFVLTDAYKGKRDAAILKQDYKNAISYSMLYENLKDSLSNKNLSDRILTLQYDFQLEKNRKDIELLNQERELHLAQNRQQRLLIRIAIGILFFGGIFSYALFRSYKKSRLLNKEIFEQKEEIQAQAEELLESNQTISTQNEQLILRNEEIAAQNEVLTQSQDEILAQRDLVALQNSKLEEARNIIELQNKEIQLRNDTLEKEIEERTKELLEYNQQLEQFAFISAHNLRAPVARILGLGNLLNLPGIEPEEEKFIREKLAASTLELDRVVRDLNTILEVKKNSNSIVTEIKLEEALRLVQLSLEKEIEETHALFDIDLSECSTFHSVRPYVDSILSNLISNSIKYRHPDRVPFIKIKTEKRDGFVCFTIKDNGLGIDLTLHSKKMFKLYSRFHGHVEGKGLGLYLVKSQVTALSGRIELESEVNIGTTFHIYLRDVV